MLKKYIFILLINIFSLGLFANSNFMESVHEMKWKIGNDLVDVVWIKDEKFPNFYASFYFQDGAINDSLSGLSQITFDQLTAGTANESQKKILSFLDFYGVNLKHTVTHEYSVLSLQALIKDMAPVMGKVCELFREAKYPKDQLNSHLNRASSHLKNLVTNHALLADRIFRKISLKDTPYAEPVEGNLESFKKINSQMLTSRLSDFNKSKKVIYLRGPTEVLEIRETIAKNCPWENQQQLEKKQVSKPTQESTIYLVEIPDANQAQIRIGRYMTSKEFETKYDHFYFLSRFLGGGFTSKLVQELRVKRGLTYSVSAYVSTQRDYGRAGVMTYSKNETTAETISLIRDIFSDVTNGDFEKVEFDHQKKHVIGGHPFDFEETDAFLSQLILYGHQQRNFRELVEFPLTIDKISKQEMTRLNMEAFPWDRLTIIVLGDKSLEKSLSKIRPVKVINYLDYL